MIKIYVMSTCPDCKEVKRLAAGDERFQLVDLGEHVHNLREFMRLRDTHPKFRVARERGLVGIPSFVLEDGTVTFKAEEAGLTITKAENTSTKTSNDTDTNAASKKQVSSSCGIDGTGC